MVYEKLVWIKGIGTDSPPRGGYFLLRGSLILGDLRSCHFLSALSRLGRLSSWNTSSLSFFLPLSSVVQFGWGTLTTSLLCGLWSLPSFLISWRYWRGMEGWRHALLVFSDSSPCWSLLPSISVMWIDLFSHHSSPVKRGVTSSLFRLPCVWFP